MVFRLSLSCSRLLHLTIISAIFLKVLVLATDERDEEFVHGTFPDDFIWSTATAAYQVEGGWNLDETSALLSLGKGPNIWDTLCHKIPNPVANNGTGDVSCDSYHLWEQDIQLIKSIGTKFYRMSISWPRILPRGLLTEGINEAGIAYYTNFFTELVENGVQPMVTLYHWDLPQHLQDMGGWLNTSSITWFQDYARLAFAEFGNKVKYWITFNEPLSFVGSGYGKGKNAPQIGNCPGTCPYIAAHNVIRAHSNAWHTYHKEFRAKQGGKVSIILDSNWCEPGSDKPEDVGAAERCMQFALGWFANPIYNNGDYPEVMKKLVARRSAAEGLNMSRLPEFSNKEINQNKGTFDFFGLNHYTSMLVFDAINTKATKQHYIADRETNTKFSSSWPKSSIKWLYFTPFGMRKILHWIRNAYGNPPVIITENGWADSGTLNDAQRIRYHKYYINNVLKAHQANCNVIGYTAWSLMDNFEWLSGYTQKFGLHFVNFSDPSRPRSAKASAAYYASIVKNNGFPKPVPSLCGNLECQFVFILFASVTVVFFLTLFYFWQCHRKCLKIVCCCKSDRAYEKVATDECFSDSVIDDCRS